MAEIMRLRTNRGFVDLDVEKFVEAYFSQARNEELSLRFNLTRMRIAELRQLLGLPSRLLHLDSKPAEPDPTPEEIIERAADVRSRWSPEERERRAVGASRRPVCVLSYRSHSSRVRSDVTFRESMHEF